jgi:uncharacterized protein with ParB-like and HNH nuclease domain
LNQWDKLWDDILEVYAMSSPRRHFIGSIVTQPIPDAPENAAKFMLIDGQQRMTTLLLLLAIIRFHAEQTGEQPSLAQEIEDTCLKNLHVRDSEEEFKLRPTLRDREAFERALRGESPGLSGQIGKAWDYFYKMVGGTDGDGNSLDLRRLKERVTLYLDLVSIQLEQGDSPNRIFESLNNTGVRLEASDLIRNYIFMRIPDEAKQNWAYDNLWFPMQEQLGSSIDDFFWRYSMRAGELTVQDDVFDDTKKSLDPLPDDEMIPQLRDFHKFSNFYLRVKDPNQYEASPKIRDQLIRLNNWEVNVSYPFLLALVAKHSEDQISDEDLTAVLGLIESFVVRRTICGVPTNRLRRIFAGMSAQCRYSEVVGSCHEYLLGNQWPNDDEFSEKLFGYRLYNPSRLSRARLILETLESSFGHKEMPQVSQDITIEHVMPQTLTPQWKQMLGHDHDEIHDRLIDSIGNLTLTGYNAPLGNKSFGEKKEILSESNFALTNDPKDGVTCADVWNEQSILNRGHRLSSRAVEIWGI